MNKLALEEESDTGYWYALSLRYIGDPFKSMENIASTIYCWTKSVDIFEQYFF
jgi:hypothetical protein